MTITRLSRPPQDLDSFLGRKWLESLIKQNFDLNTIADLTFLLLAANPNLPNSRRLFGSADILLTDGGPQGDLVLSLTTTGVAAGTYGALNIVPVIDVDTKGRITSASNVPISVAPPNATFVTMSLNGTLTSERVLTASSNVSVTDGGANGNVTLDLTNTGVSPGVYTSVTVDAKGRVTAGSDVTSFRRTFLLMGA